MIIEYPAVEDDDVEYPTLGPQVQAFIEEYFTFGPGSLQGQPAKLSDDQRRVLYRAYEHYPKGYKLYGMDVSGRRRFPRVSWSVRKGSAKCLAPGTRLISAAGTYIKVEDLHYGDQVLSWQDGKGVFRRVAGVEKQPSTAVYRVKTAHGREIETSVGHPFLVSGTPWRPGMPKRWRYTSCDPAAGDESWVEGQDLRPGDRLVPGLGWSWETPKGDGGDLGWLLGVLIGDCTGDGRLSNADLEVASRVGHHFEMTKLKHRQEGQYYLRGSRDFFEEHGLLGKNAYSKTTPLAVLTGDADIVRGYLAGLLDTDGTTMLRELSGGKQTRVVEWYSVSKSLMEDVQHLLAGIGINATLREKKSTYKGELYISWTVVVSDHVQVAELADLLPVVRNRNVENMRASKETLSERGKFGDIKLDKVVSVERIADAETYAVEIEDTHVHVTNGLVTHNTEFMAWVTGMELHPDAPVRWTGYDPTAPGGLKTGRPVNNPYIPLLAYTKDQTEELAFGALRSILETTEDADRLFDIGKQRIIRKNEFGAEDGKCHALAGNPNSADGARTTFQGLDEPLALDTEVPTPEGWKNIGDLEAGDQVFDRWGEPVKVSGVAPIHVGRECYRVTFDDGSSVVTDGSHRWKAVEWSNRPKGEQVVTTKEMLDRGLNTKYGARWRLPKSEGFDSPDTADLLIDPYLLGIWLGDGATDAGYIHCHEADFDEMSEGIEHTVAATVPGRESVVRWLPRGLRSLLRQGGLLGNKHIPESYMFASRAQRKALLAGLIDTDGHVVPGTNSVTFVQGKERLARDVYSLVRSFGWGASIRSRVDERSRTGLMWKVQFCVEEELPTRLARKALGDYANGKKNRAWPKVISIEPVDSVPVRCIEVDNDDHLFVFGRSGFLTHNTHRLYTQTHRDAIETMLNNLPKRPLEDPWQLAITTAGEPGQGSYAEDEYREGVACAQGKKSSAGFYFLHRQAPDGSKFDTMQQRMAAIWEATSPSVREWTRFDTIAANWDREGADKQYLERVWANRWTQTAAQAFDRDEFEALGDPRFTIPDGAFVTVGFDGAKFQDSTGFVVTEIETGKQNVLGFWARPDDDKIARDEDGKKIKWQVPEAEVNACFDEIMRRFKVWRLYGDPPHWVETMANWHAKYPDQVYEFWTKDPTRMYYAVKSYRSAIASGAVSHNGDPDLISHIGNTGKRTTRGTDEDDEPRFVLTKIAYERKFDLAVCAILSWQARMDAINEGAQPPQEMDFIRVR